METKRSRPLADLARSRYYFRRTADRGFVGLGKVDSTTKKYENGSENDSENENENEKGIIARPKAKEPTDLPRELFGMMASSLLPRDIVCCRRVSRNWNIAFGLKSEDLLKLHFPNAREVRIPGVLGPNPNWARTYDRVATRYHHILAARPRVVEKIPALGMGDAGTCRIAQWSRWLRWNDYRAVFQHEDPAWSYDDGILVYQEEQGESWVAYDLETERLIAIPFDTRNKLIRRVRLADGVLVFEWCDSTAFRKLEWSEGIHRHYATAFDVTRDMVEVQLHAGSEQTVVRTSVDITFRSEWKIHPFGLTLIYTDRFFSAHTRTHYAVYVWESEPAPWGEEPSSPPLERLTIWDISQPSSYRPSEDEAKTSQPTATPATNTNTEGPKVINRLEQRDLEFFGVRQRRKPRLRAIHLDEANVYIHEEEHRWLRGPHATQGSTRNHLVRSTGIPFTGFGPRWFDQCGADNVHMNFCPRAGPLARTLNNSTNTNTADTKKKFAKKGPLWPGWAPCWRHDEFPYLTLSEAVDLGAGVKIAARQCFMLEALSQYIRPRINVQIGQDAIVGGLGAGSNTRAPDIRFGEGMWREMMAAGKIAGDERWIVGEDCKGNITVVRF
ncbi:hypothetical protein F5Y11DRAFT_284435 [Daldinia sp. FL1419]|nr:hypothetical protein F5Y11DRAFT_284435 [Daldinia sp. FL1419]